MAATYRARRPRASPWWQCLESGLGDFLSHYPTRYQAGMGPLRPVVPASLFAFLRCGDLGQGFARIRCADCAHEYLLPFTCKKRGACPSCHQRRSVETAQAVATERCAAVPHRHIVLTVPRALRWIFRRQREHFTLLFASAHEALRLWFHGRTGLPRGEIAAIAALHTFGDYLVFHPHLHILAASGMFDENGAFHLAPPGGRAGLAEIFRHILLRRLVDHGIIQARQAHRFLSWRHSGFNVNTGDIPLAADDAPARRRLIEYLLRGPLSLEKMHWNPATRTVLYRSARSWRTKRNFEIYSASDFIAALSEHIPEKHAQMIRYLGRYSNKRRGQLARAAGRAAKSARRNSHLADSSLPARSYRRSWRQLIIRVWGADPLRCPCCGGVMRKVQLVEEPADIEAWLRRLGLWEGLIALPPAQAPPPPAKTTLWGVDTEDGSNVEFEPGGEIERLPSRPLYKIPRERYRTYTSEDSGKTDPEPDLPDAEESQLTTWEPATQLREDGLLLVFDADPPPPDDVPIFWTD